MNHDKEMWARIKSDGKIYDYSVSDLGRVIRTTKKTCNQINVKAYLYKKNLCVKICNKTCLVKKLVAQKHSKKYKEGMSISFADGNSLNCKAKNLVFFTKKDLGSLTGSESRSQAVICNGELFRSKCECAKHLFCSYQTLNDYVNGKVKNSILNGMDITEV